MCRFFLCFEILPQIFLGLDQNELISVPSLAPHLCPHILVHRLAAIPELLAPHCLGFSHCLSPFLFSHLLSLCLGVKALPALPRWIHTHSICLEVHQSHTHCLPLMDARVSQQKRQHTSLRIPPPPKIPNPIVQLVLPVCLVSGDAGGAGSFLQTKGQWHL